MPKNSAGGASGARPAVAEVRSCVSVRVGRRVRGRSGDRDLDDVLQRRTFALGARGSHAGRGLRRGAGSVTASTSSTLRPTTAGTLVAGFPRGRFSASPGTRVLSFSRASSTISPADALRGPGPLGAREGAGDVAAGCIERSARPLPVAGAGLDQAAQRLVCGAAPRAVLDGHLIARQADRAVDVADGTGPASSRTPYPTAEQAGPQVLRAPVAAALSSPPPDPLPGLAAALRGLTHEAARFPSSSSSMIRYQTDDEGVVSQPEYTLTKPSNGPNDRDHLTQAGVSGSGHEVSASGNRPEDTPTA